MWQNNGFHGHGNYQTHMDSANYQQSFDAEDGFIPFSSDGIDQQFYQHPSQMSYNEDGDSFVQGFQPEVGLYNEQQFTQNSYLTQNSPEQYTPQLPNTTQATPRPGPELDARTRELKAKLMEGKAQRGQSGTPPVASAVTVKTTKNSDGTNSLRQSPETPLGISPPGEMESVSVTAEDVEDLLSEHRPVPANNLENEKSYATSSFKAAQHQTLKGQDAQAIALSSTATSSMKLANSNIRNGSLIKTPNGKLNRNQSNGEGSDASDGEIREEQVTNAIQPVPSLNEVRHPSNLQNVSEQRVSKHRKEESGNKFHGIEDQTTSPKLRTSVQSTRAPLRYQEERHDPSEARYEKKNLGHVGMNERRSQQESEQRPLSRRSSSEDHRRHETKYDTRREEIVSRKPAVPTLEQLLAVDEDLKEWLEITGYHKTEYRNKTLNRRRALAALDAQRAKMDEEREKLLQELENERGGDLLAASAPSKIIPSPMPPPPIPNKTGVSPAKLNEETVRESVDRSGKQESGTKRNYDDFRGSRSEESTEKSVRLGDEGRGYRIKGEAEEEDRRSYSGGHESSRRRSPPPDSRAYRQEDRESSYHMEDRGRGRGRGNDREDSPGLQAFHNRPPARSTSHGWHDPNEVRDHDDRADRRDSRPYVVIGNYRGRDYDPNYRGRGRGRGNWANNNNDRDQHTQQTQQQLSPDQRRTYGQRIATGTASKEMIKWDKGGKGDTRYFIVKSFNEENVVRCMEDSIWTTQVQNGDLFRDAFNTCKNVILVFSINQSKAFQGYARMASLPGTEHPPRWQKSINWESTGAFKVSWITIASTRFSRVGHLKNSLNEGQAVLIGKDGQEIEERCGEELLKLIDEEAERQISGMPPLPPRRYRDPEIAPWDD